MDSYRGKSRCCEQDCSFALLPRPRTEELFHPKDPLPTSFAGSKLSSFPSRTTAGYNRQPHLLSEDHQRDSERLAFPAPLILLPLVSVSLQILSSVRTE